MRWVGDHWIVQMVSLLLHGGDGGKDRGPSE